VKYLCRLASNLGPVANYKHFEVCIAVMWSSFTGATITTVQVRGTSLTVGTSLRIEAEQRVLCIFPMPRWSQTMLTDKCVFPSPDGLGWPLLLLRSAGCPPEGPSALLPVSILHASLALIVLQCIAPPAGACVLLSWGVDFKES
jgi:hypothetical protein